MMNAPHVQVVAIEGPVAGKAVVLHDRESVVFGRSRSCLKGQLPDSDRTVSRKHFFVEVDLPAVRVWDLGSEHGTFVKKSGVKTAAIYKVPLAEQKLLLNHGDLIRAGRSVFEIRVCQPAGENPADENTLCPVCGRGLQDDADGNQPPLIAIFCPACMKLDEQWEHSAAPLTPPPAVAKPQAAPPPPPSPKQTFPVSPRSATPPVPPVPPVPPAPVAPVPPAPIPVAVSPDSLPASETEPTGFSGGSLVLQTRYGPPVVEGYHVEKKLGNGCLGASFLCQRKQDELPLALKIIRSDLAFSEPACQKIQADLGRLARLRHPHLMPLLDYGITPFDGQGTGFAFLQPYCPAGNLLQFAAERGGKLLPHVIYDLMGDLLSGLAYLHEQGLVHGNLNPRNVLVVPRGDQKIARLGDNCLIQFLRQHGVIITPSIGYDRASLPFLSEEQIKNPAAAGYATDLWSLSAIFYFLFTHEHPRPESRSGPTPAPVRIRGYFNAVPEGLESLLDLIDQGLASDPANNHPGAARAMEQSLRRSERPRVVSFKSP